MKYVDQGPELLFIQQALAHGKLCVSSVTDLTSTVSLAQQERGRGDRRRVGEDVDRIGRHMAVFLRARAKCPARGT